MVNSKNSRKSLRKKVPLVEVIILTHNNKEILNNCLISLKKSSYKSLLVTVVDQKSSDGTKEFVEKTYVNGRGDGKEKKGLGIRFRVIRNKENKSFSKGNNDVLKKSKADYCLLLNDDTEVDENSIEILVNEIMKDDEIAAVQPKILDLKEFKKSNGKKKFEYAGACGGFIDIYGYPNCRGRIFDFLEEDNGQYNDSREVFWGCGVAMLISMETFKKIGRLDETLGSYAEELDWSWRANLAGFKIKVVPKAIVKHIGSSSWKRKNLEFKKDYLIFRNHFYVMLKNYSIKNWIKVLPGKIILEKIAFFNFFFRKPKRAWAILLANLWIIFNIRLIIKKNKEVEKLRKISDSLLRKRMVGKSFALQHNVAGKNKFNEFIKFIEDY